MKKLKRFSLFVAIGLIMLSISACKSKVSYNTSIPMGNLASDAIVAQAGDNYKIKNSIYYDQLRHSGYNMVLNNIKKALFKTEYDEVKAQINLSDSTVTKVEQDLFDSYCADIYGTSDVNTLKDKEEKDLNISRQKYVDTLSNRNIKVTTESLQYTIQDNNVSFKDIPSRVIDEKLVQLAINKATKDELIKIVDSEKIENEDGKLISNTNYISKDNIINSYNSTEMNYGTYKAIVIQFNSLFEAENYYNDVEKLVGPITASNAIEFYTKLYNHYYNYRIQLTNTPFDGSEQNSRAVFVVNEDKDELSEVSSSVKSLLLDTLEEDGQYIPAPFNQNNKYVMIYRGETVYEINDKYHITPANKKLEWEDLEEKNSEAANEVYEQVKDRLIDNKVATYSSTVIKKRIADAEIKVFDPFFERSFKSSYDEEYEYINPNDFNNDLVFELKYNGVTSTYSVQQFYEDQTNAIGLTTLINLMKLEYIYQFKDRLLEEDDINTYTQEIQDAINDFNKNGSASIPIEFGEQTFLLSNYGYSTKDDVIKYNKIATAILQKYLAQTVFDEWAKDDHTVADNLTILENIRATGNKNYANLFSIEMDHILIFIDDDGDGSPDDPSDFFEKNSSVVKKDFENAVLDLSKAIYREANSEKLTSSNDIMDILKHIVTAYNKNELMFSENHTWDYYKKYNFQLKVESLSSSGSTNETSVQNYVKPFADYIEKLYEKVKADNLDTDDGDKPVFYFIESGAKEPTAFEDICATQFGYHMIVVNDWDNTTTTKKLSSSDSYGYYKDIEILINEKDSDNKDDNIYVVVPNLYNEDEKEANMNQFFTYYVQSQKGYTSSIDSTMSKLFDRMFSSAITRYTSKEFQEYLLFNRMNMTIADTTLNEALSNYKNYLKNVSQNYDTEDDFNDWYSDTMNWNRPY